MKKITLLKKQLLLIILLLFSNFSKGQILDQSNACTDIAGSVATFSTSSNVGQSFIAGQTGNLSQVNIRVGSWFNTFAAGNFQLRIYPGNGHTGAVLNTTVFSLTSVPVDSFIEKVITLSSLLPVTAGSSYTINLRGTAGSVDTNWPNANYVNGGIYVNNGSNIYYNSFDLWFKTFLADGSALNFGGANDMVAVGSNALYSNLGMGSFTLESWINPSSLSSIKSIIRKDGDYNLYKENEI